MSAGDRQRIEHILAYCDEVTAAYERFGKDLETFVGDRLFFHGVSMCLLQIGELAKGLSDDFLRGDDSQIPWSAIKGMRDWFAHGYGVMDKQVIWETGSKDIPVLAAFCTQWLSSEN
jgi:uncharacterized protein with HEPN domain